MRFSAASNGAWFLLLSSLIGLAASLFAYLWTGNGIHGSAGALLIVITTALMFLAAAALAGWPATPRWLRGLLLFLILVDIVGSGFAAYMLEAWSVVGAMALSLIAWAFQALPVGSGVPSPPRTDITSRVTS